MRGRLRAAAVAVALLGAMSGVGAAAQPASASASECHFVWKTLGGVEGWYAGLSNTNTTNTKQGQSGARVKEVQCLLLWARDYTDDARLDPHGVDGQFGPNTETAVENAQRYYLFRGQPSQWDGQVGPKTWPELRHLSWYYNGG